MKLKILFILPIIFIQSFAFANSDDSEGYDLLLLEQLRSSYYAGVEDESYIDSLESLIVENFGDDISQYPPVILAYRAGIFALESKHAFWPFSKMSYLNDSMELFEKALKNDPENLEIRFMRFSILYYVPGILGYSKEKEEDLNIIYDLLPDKDYTKLDIEIQQGIIQFILDSDLLNEKQEIKLRNIHSLASSDE